LAQSLIMFPVFGGISGWYSTIFNIVSVWVVKT